MAVDGIAERPEDFAKDMPQPGGDELSWSCAAYVDRLRASGARVENYLVDLHLKLAFPLVNFIVVLIGASLATRAARRRARRWASACRCVIAFLYYAFMRTGQALGHNGRAAAVSSRRGSGDMVFGRHRRS